MHDPVCLLISYLPIKDLIDRSMFFLICYTYTMKLNKYYLELFFFFFKLKGVQYPQNSPNFQNSNENRNKVERGQSLK